MKIPCKNCFSGKPRTNVTVTPPQSWTDGKGVVFRTCPDCGYSQTTYVEWDADRDAPVPFITGWNS